MPLLSQSLERSSDLGLLTSPLVLGKRQHCTTANPGEYEGPGKRAHCSTANPGEYEGWSELEEALSRKSALEDAASRRAELEEAVIRRVELEEAVVRRAELEKSSSRRADLQDTVQRRSNMLGPQGQGNSSTPCAACKLLRRRCAQECPFSPYFSPLEPQKFACVHKIFGASNVSKMLLEVPESQRADAASSLVYEANARIRDPVYGCMGAISALQHQAQTLQAELQAVRSEILRYRCHESMMVSGGYSGNQNDRSTGPGNISSQSTAASDVTYNSPSGVGTPDVKERYWSSMN